ncbi:hypothetical protein GPJ56_009211 [Histomonas meleagridis]|uniref:uncharacterized protein n=1 Tax=Histomonas meleagridis TaxID=135588 RepID=UPI003559DD9E|nr:hypothetical protein GPJ56_009211 [Histomonas meleagridis]KAH0801584.1 hypothetical protein GO595_005583 [Histomonas meleagridis]
MVERTNEFYHYLSEFDSVGSATRTLKKSTCNYFHEAAFKITEIITSISSSIEENFDAYVDKYSSVLALKSSMTDESRTIFTNQISDSISKVEMLITELAKDVNSGKLGIKGDAITHSSGVFQYLDYSLNKVRKDFAYMQNQRQVYLTKYRELDEKLPIITTNNFTRIEQEKPKISSDFKRKLALEHQSVVDDMLQFHDTVTQTERVAEEIAQMNKLFNTLIGEQNEKIRVIREEVEKASTNYEVGISEVDKATKRAKKEHFMISLFILFLSLILVLTQIKNNRTHL